MIKINCNDDILTDDVIMFIAERYNTSPKTILDSFFKQNEGDGINDNSLEDNEMQIIRDLIKMYNKK